MAALASVVNPRSSLDSVCRTVKSVSGSGGPGSALFSTFVGEPGKLFLANSSPGSLSTRYLLHHILVAVHRDGDSSRKDVSPLFSRNLHLTSKRDYSSTDTTALATAEYVVAEEERRTELSDRRRGFPSTARTGLFAYPDSEEDEGEAGAVDGDELAIANLGIPQEVVAALAGRGITHLFPIQRAVLEPAMQGKDLIARAKTGTGKTLAFGIPIINNIMRENENNRLARFHGRPPRALILAPTRELAKQVEKEFMESAPTLSTVCVYGGVSITGQQRQLQKGVDVAVGTPGRIIDLIERGSLVLNDVQFLVLDEADQMLAVGFEEDVETILERLPAQRQGMLFSATMPAWVKKLSSKYLNRPLIIDLVGESEEKLAEGIQILSVQVTSASKRSMLNDLITVYAKGGKTIVFTQTKRDADEVAMAMGRMIGCEALHGDITQGQREKTLNAFREGRFSVLVATDVAARGLDIPNVDLVVHYEIPNDPETFVHRSGRTGRAGKVGITILMYSAQQTRTMRQIERDVGCKFERVVPPSVDQVLLASSEQAKEVINRVHPDLAEVFLLTAEKLLEEKGPSAFAAAIAHLSGFSQPPASRSLITFEEGYTTLRIIRSPQGNGGRLTSARAVMGTLASIHPTAANNVGRIKMIDDRNVEGAVFDLPDDIAKEVLLRPRDPCDMIDVPKVLPRVEEDDLSRGRSDMYGRVFSRGGRGSFDRGDRDDRRGGNGRFVDRNSGDRFMDRRSGDGFRSSRSDDNDDWSMGSSPRRGGNSRRIFAGVCYICSQAGHRAADCPSR